MQRFPHAMCHDPFHHAHSFEDQLVTGVEQIHQVGGWTALGFGCRTCGFQSMRRVTQTRLDKVKSVCPGCDTIRLDWDDEVGTLCPDCRLRDVRVVSFDCDPHPDFDRIAVFQDWPTLHWDWSDVVEAMR